jgi:hypothetical protein
MKFHYDLTGAQQIIKDYPVYGAGSALAIDAALMRGATPGTDSGFGIVAAGTLAGIIGVLQEAHADPGAAGDDSKQDGSAYGLRKVLINPFAVWLAEHVDAATAALVIDSVTTTAVTVTAGEDNVDGGWMLGSDGQLQYITASTTTNRTTKSSTGWTAAITYAHIQPIFHAIGELSSVGVKIQNTLATTDGKMRVIENYIKANGIPFQKLNPTKHSGLTLTNPVVYSDIVFTDHVFGING